jgi:glycosyltransferase involved in cell wall biosynthesis
LKRLNVCIDARVVDGQPGGIQQFIIGLATGLSKLNPGDERYFFLVYQGSQDWITPYIAEYGQAICIPGPPGPSMAAALFKRIPANWALLWLVNPIAARLKPVLPRSDGTIERAGIDVVHFTTQAGFLTGVPSIYHPHDLLHRHYPHYLPKWSVIKRDIAYRAFCRQAHSVAAASRWVKEDLKQCYGLTDEKIAVIPLAPATESYPDPTPGQIADVRMKFGLPDDFILYPAQTWPHKNHIGLLRALLKIYEVKGFRVPLVSAGKLNDFFPQVRKIMHALHLQGQVHFLDYVTPLELQCLYRLCRLVVVPSKFEAASFPLWEAFRASKAVCCSKVTSLPDQAGGAAVLFDPDDTDQMAGAIWSLWSDEELRNRLIAVGRERVASFSWEKTAELFRGLYRRIGGLPITDRQRELMNTDMF